MYEIICNTQNTDRNCNYLASCGVEIVVTFVFYI